MASTRAAGIGIDDDTYQLLVKLEKVTGVPRREHLRRAVQRYFDQAPDHLTEVAVAELAKMPATARELKRAEGVRGVGSQAGPVLRKADRS